MDKIRSRIIPEGIQVISDKDTSYTGFYILQNLKEIHTYASYVRWVDSDKGQNRMILCQRVKTAEGYENRRIMRLRNPAEKLKQELEAIVLTRDKKPWIGVTLEEDLQFAIKHLEQYFKVSEITKMPWAIDEEIYQILVR